MEKFKQLKKIKEIYASGGNIIEFLKDGGDLNTVEDILISYDFQSGSYVKNFRENNEFKMSYCQKLADTIAELGDFNSIMEVGVGEATTLGPLSKMLNNPSAKKLGFDISWSRLKFGQNFLKEEGIEDISLFTADLFEIPLKDNSVDIVYTSHSLEPNGGNEKAALKELYRVARKYVVLLEPAFELANEEAQERMKSHGYVRNLVGHAGDLGFSVLKNELFGLSANPLNPTGLIIIEKNSAEPTDVNFVCPLTHRPIEKYSDSLLYSKESLLAYPVIDGIPCLLKDNAILATHLLTDYQEFKSQNNIG